MKIRVKKIENDVYMIGVIKEDARIPSAPLNINFYDLSLFSTPVTKSSNLYKLGLSKCLFAFIFTYIDLLPQGLGAFSRPASFQDYMTLEVVNVRVVLQPIEMSLKCCRNKYEPEHFFLTSDPSEAI